MPLVVSRNGQRSNVMGCRFTDMECPTLRSNWRFHRQHQLIYDNSEIWSRQPLLKANCPSSNPLRRHILQQSAMLWCIFAPEYQLSWHVHVEMSVRSNQMRPAMLMQPSHISDKMDSYDYATKHTADAVTPRTMDMQIQWRRMIFVSSKTFCGLLY